MSGNSRQIKAHLALFAANLIYGINYTVAKDVMPAFIKPSGFVVIRVVGAVLLFWLISLKEKLSQVQKADYFRFFLCGFFGVALNQIMFFEGLSRTSPINCSIIMVVTPILVLIISSILLKERISLLKIIGIALGLTGAVLLILVKKDVTFSTTTITGDVMVFINAVSYAVYLVLVKPLMKKYPTLLVMKVIFLVGTAIIIPVGISPALQVQWQELTYKLAGEILFVIVFTTFLAYLLNTGALKVVSPSLVSFYIYLQPILAASIALLLGKDEIDIIKIISTVLVFTGVYCVSHTSTIEKKT